MNKIDEIIQNWKNHEEADRVYRLALFDYYLTRYFELAQQKFDEVENCNISDKAMINFLFICLNSTEKESYGLFEAFPRFKIVCGLSRRILAVLQPDVERLFVLMPEHRMHGENWLRRTLKQRPKLWHALGDNNIADFIHDSSVGDYARMIDRGFDNFLNKTAPCCLADTALPFDKQTEWSSLINASAKMLLTQKICTETNRRYTDIRNSFSSESLVQDKQLLLSVL